MGPVRLLNRAEVDEVSALEFTIPRVDMEQCCLDRAYQCLTDAHANHKRGWRLR